MSSAEYELEDMIAQRRYDMETTSWMLECAKSHMLDHDIYGADISLEIAELYLEVVKKIKASTPTVANIRKLREKVQWEKKKLKPNAERSQSSSNSVT